MQRVIADARVLVQRGKGNARRRFHHQHPRPIERIPDGEILHLLGIRAAARVGAGHAVDQEARRLDVDARERLRIESRRAGAIAHVLVGRRIPFAAAGSRPPAARAGRTVLDVGDRIVIGVSVVADRVREFAPLRARARHRVVGIVVAGGDRRRRGGPRETAHRPRPRGVRKPVAAADGTVAVRSRLFRGRRARFKAPDRVRIAGRQIDCRAAVCAGIAGETVNVDAGPRGTAGGVGALARKARAIGLLARRVHERVVVVRVVVIGASDRRVVLADRISAAWSGRGSAAMLAVAAMVEVGRREGDKVRKEVPFHAAGVVHRQHDVRLDRVEPLDRDLGQRWIDRGAPRLTVAAESAPRR